MTVVEIRAMRPEDIPDMLKIEKVSYTTPWSETSFHSEIYSPRASAKVAECGGLIVGYVCVRRVLDECHLLNMTVHPDFRRQGLGSLLLSAVLDDLQSGGCGFVYLEVRASNKTARRLYERFGFKHIGTRKLYYVSPPEDAVVMMREITCRGEGV